MHQSKKGHQWYFGMKVHIGVYKDSGLIHSVETTAANVHDLTPAAELPHGIEEVVYADACYQGIGNRPEMEGTTNHLSLCHATGEKARPSRYS